MTICVIFGSLICIWAIYQTFFRPYSFDELLALDHISTEEEAKTLAAFFKRVKTKDDIDALWEYIFRYASETGHTSSYLQFHYLLWISYLYGDDDDFALAKLAATGCTGIPFEELMFPAPTFLDK